MLYCVGAADVAAMPIPENHQMQTEAWAWMPVRRVHGGAVIAGVAAVMLALPAGAASQCKGLAEAQCRANAACAWMPARVAGQTKRKDGEAHKSSARAHCRLNTRKSG
jgi:hypothetical protein